MGAVEVAVLAHPFEPPHQTRFRFLPGEVANVFCHEDGLTLLAFGRCADAGTEDVHAEVDDHVILLDTHGIRGIEPAGGTNDSDDEEGHSTTDRDVQGTERALDGTPHVLCPQVLCLWQRHDRTQLRPLYRRRRTLRRNGGKRPGLQVI